MSRKTRKSLKAERITGNGTYRDIPEGSRFLMVAICRAAVPTMPHGLMSDEQIVNSIFELIGKGLLELYFTTDRTGITIFTELKNPTNGGVCTNPPVFVPFADHAQSPSSMQGRAG